jgi:hypothetical protein
MARSSLRWTLPTFLALQLGLLWIQGAQIHRQNQVLQSLREDIQGLAESIENSQGATAYEDEGAAVPAGFLPKPPPPKEVAVLGVQEEQDSAMKDLQAARESVQKAQKDAQEARSKLSVEENIRKVEEAKKIQSTTDSWQRWVWGATALVALALVGRSILRRRG